MKVNMVSHLGAFKCVSSLVQFPKLTEVVLTIAVGSPASTLSWERTFLLLWVKIASTVLHSHALLLLLLYLLMWVCVHTYASSYDLCRDALQQIQSEHWAMHTSVHIQCLSLSAECHRIAYKNRKRKKTFIFARVWPPDLLCWLFLLLKTPEHVLSGVCSLILEPIYK